jgi:hypothetical protein
LNYGLRWEVNTPLTDVGQKVQRFNPGQNSTIYPCQLSATSNLFGPGNTCDNQGVTPTGLVVPGDKGVPGGLFDTYYKAFAPRLGLNWSPAWKDGALSKLTGGPNKTTVSMGWGLFYNPIEQLVLEQFVAEPPFGISNGVSNPLFGSPFRKTVPPSPMSLTRLSARLAAKPSIGHSTVQFCFSASSLPNCARNIRRSTT